MRRNNVILSLKLLLIVVGTTFAYWRDLTILFDDALKNEMINYVLAVPFMVMFMIYSRRKTIGALVSFQSRDHRNPARRILAGSLLCFSAIFTYSYGSFTFKALEYHLLSLPIFVLGCALLLFNFHALHALFYPVAFLYVLVLPLWDMVYEAGSQLSVLTSTIAYNMLGLLRVPASMSWTMGAPTIIIERADQQVSFVIDIPCAGIYSLMGFAMFALFIGYLAKGSLVKRGGWLLSGFLLLYAMNITRIVMIVLLGYWHGEEIAMNLFHLLSGPVLIFAATVLLIAIGEKILGITLVASKTKVRQCPICEENKRRGDDVFCPACGRFLNVTNQELSDGSAIIVVALMAVLLIIANIQLPAFALTRQNTVELNLQEPTGSWTAQEFLPKVDGYKPRFLYRDTKFEEISNQDAALVYVYLPENKSKASIFAAIEIADSYTKLHRWETCLISAPSEYGAGIVVPMESRDIQILENPLLIGHVFVFKYVKSDSPVVVLYWFEKAPFKIDSNLGYKYMKTSLLAYVNSFVRTGEIESPQEYSQLVQKLISISQKTVSYWEPVKVWTFPVLFFGQWAQPLAIATMFFAVLFSTLRLLELREEKDNFLAYKQLGRYSSFMEREKATKQIVEILDEKGKLTVSELADFYGERTGESVELKKIIKIITHAKELGLVREEIVIEDGEPLLKWTSLISNSDNLKNN